MIKMIKKVVVAGTVLGLVALSGLTTVKGQSWSDFEFQFGGVYDARETGWLEKKNNDCITMQCTFMDVPDAYYRAYAVDHNGGTTDSKEFYEGTWHYFYNDMQRKNVKMHGILLEDYGWGGSYASGYWHVDSGIAQ